MKEWNEDKLDQELEAIINEIPDEKYFEERLEKSIDARIRKIVFRTLGIIAVIALIAFLIINPLMNAVHFNPEKLVNEDNNKLLLVLRDYFELIHPNKELINVKVDKKGFGRYGIQMQVSDITEPITVGQMNIYTEMNRGHYENIIDSNSYTVSSLSIFSVGENKDEILDRMADLPKSAKIFLSVSAKEAKDINSLRTLPGRISWGQVYQPNTSLQAGLTLMPAVLSSENDVREELTEIQLLDLYRTKLKNLLDNKELWLSDTFTDGSLKLYPANQLQETYEDAKSLTRFEIKNFCIHGSRDEMIQFLKENSFDSINIDKVNLW